MKVSSALRRPTRLSPLIIASIVVMTCDRPQYHDQIKFRWVIEADAACSNCEMVSLQSPTIPDHSFRVRKQPDVVLQPNEIELLEIRAVKLGSLEVWKTDVSVTEDA